MELTSFQFIVLTQIPTKGDGITEAEITDRLSKLGINSFGVWNVLKDLIRFGLVKKRKRRGETETVYLRRIGTRFDRIAICEYCRNPYQKSRHNQRFCSTACRVKNHLLTCERCRQRSLERFKKRFGIATERGE